MTHKQLASLFTTFFLFFSSSFNVYAAEKNKIIVCDNGLEMFHWDLDFLAVAEQSVEVLACFFGGDIARELLTAIDLRLSEVSTLQVHILASPILLEPEDWEMIDSLKERYPENFHIEFATQVARINPELVSTDNHIKLCVVDETFFSAGGTNLQEKHCSAGTFKPNKKKTFKLEADKLLPLAMRDQDVVGKGAIAKELRRIFFQLYSLWEHYNETKILDIDPKDFIDNCHYFEVSANPYLERFEDSKRVREVSNESIELFIGGPHQKNNVITQEYIELIQEAKEEIVLEHLFFLPLDLLLNALMDAVNRGVKIVLITNGLGETTNGANLFSWGNRMSYVPLFYGCTFHFWDVYSAAAKPVKNTQIFEYAIDDVWLHKKMMIIDKKTLVVGSYNLGVKSAYGDYELILVIKSEEVAQDAFKVHESDLCFSRRVTPELARHWYFDPFISFWGQVQKKFSGFL